MHSDLINIALRVRRRLFHTTQIDVKIYKNRQFKPEVLQSEMLAQNFRPFRYNFHYGYFLAKEKNFIKNWKRCRFVAGEGAEIANANKYKTHVGDIS